MIPRISWLVTAFMLACGAQAQEPTFMGAATHPGQGQVYSRALIAIEGNDDYMIHGRLVYGIISPLALQLDAHHEWLGEDSDDSSVATRLKFRFHQNDFGPINTWRASAVVGVEFLSDNDPTALLGIVTTAIIERHGLNGQIDWAGYASEPDEFRINASHLFRIVPAQYIPSTKGAWYTEIESLNTVYDNGNYEMNLAPGLLYEARQWAAETSLRLPVAGTYYDQPNYTLAFGLRYLF